MSFEKEIILFENTNKAVIRYAQRKCKDCGTLLSEKRMYLCPRCEDIENKEKAEKRRLQRIYKLRSHLSVI